MDQAALKNCRHAGGNLPRDTGDVRRRAWRCGWGILLVAGALLLLTESVSAQYYFGKNKIQYTDFDWLVLSTTHFDIYFYEAERELAEVSAESAERSYAILADRFNHEVERRIPLIIYSCPNFFTETNVISSLLPENVGGFTEFLKGRVVMPFNGSYPRFRRVLQHELVHVFQLSKLTSVVRAHKKTNTSRPPLWFTEGQAEYYSGEWNSDGDMVLSDLVLSGRLTSLDGMAAISGSYLMYKAGESFFHFLEEKYGPEYVLRIYENWWRGRSLDEVVRITFEKSLREIGVEWGYWLKKRYFPTIEHHDFPDRVATPLTRSGYNVKPVPLRLTVDGEAQDWIAFKGNRLGYAGLYMARETGSGRELETLLRGERSSEFESLHLLQSGVDASADGRVVFSSKRYERDVLYVLDAASKRVVDEFIFDSLYMISSPSFSPDGSRVAFSGCGKDGTHDLFLYGLETGVLRRLTSDMYLDADPVFTPDGTALIFTSDRGPYGADGFMNLYRIELAGEHTEAIAAGTLAGDGNRGDISGMPFSAGDEAAGPALPVTPRIRAVTSGRYNDRTPAFKPGSEDMIFSSDREGRYNIYRRRANGEIDRLTNFSTGAFDARYLPDDEGIVFTAYQGTSFQVFGMPLPDSAAVVVQAPVDSATAPAVVLADSAFIAAWKPLGGHREATDGAVRYRNRFSFDIAQSAVSFDGFYGTIGGMQTALTDILGNHQYYFLIANNASTKDDFVKSFNIAVNYINREKRLNYGYGAFHLYDSYNDPVVGSLRERQYGAAGYIGYPLSKFRRIESSLYVRQSEREVLFGGEKREGLLATQFIGFVHDNSLWDVSGPIDGYRLMVSFGYTADLSSFRSFNRLAVIDARKYFRLGQHSAFASRILSHFSSGQEPQRRYLGGSWDLRGYPRRGQFARNVFLFSNELRFPFINALFVGFPGASLGFRAIRGAIFFDAGNAWEDDFGRMKGALGVGARVSLGYVIVLRFDWARRTDFRTIDDRTNFEFFFGWNF